MRFAEYVPVLSVQRGLVKGLPQLMSKSATREEESMG